MRKPSLRQVLFVELVIVALCMSSFGYVFSVPSSTFTLSAGVYPGAPTYTIWNETGTIYAKNAYGALLSYAGSSNTSYVINSVISLIISTGGYILLEPGRYVLDSPIIVPESLKGSTTKSIGLGGRNWEGISLFIVDVDNLPFSETILEPSASYHGSLIKIGSSSDTNGKSASVTIENLVLSGIPTSSPKASRQGAENITMTADEAGIKGYNLQHSILRNLMIVNCYYGIYTTTAASSESDGVLYENIDFGYNRYHLRIDGFSTTVWINRVSGYLSYATAFYFSALYISVQDLISNADDYEITTWPESTVYVSSRGTAFFRNIVIMNSKDATYAGVRGINLQISANGTLADFDDVIIQGVNGDAVYTAGNSFWFGTIRFSNLYASPSVGQCGFGGEGRNSAFGINRAAGSNSTMLFVEDSDLRNNVFGAFQGSTANLTVTNTLGYP